MRRLAMRVPQSFHYKFCLSKKIGTNIINVLIGVERQFNDRQVRAALLTPLVQHLVTNSNLFGEIFGIV